MKSLPAIASLLFLIFVLLLCFPPASPCEEAAFKVLETEGNAAGAGSDQARARTEAVRDALKKAVGQVAGQWLSPQDAAKNNQLLKEHLYNRAEEFIQDYRIVSERNADVYTLSVRSTVFEAGIRNKLLGLGLLKPLPPSLPVARFSLTIREIRDYNGYVRCREILKEGGLGIRGAVLREASWGLARFDIAATEKMAVVVERLREKLSLEIHHQDDRVLEVSLK
ncbi:MAG: hypothetical protein M0009_11095 [Deltaproteobacteria bacterium]|nr:hypothetical protein [Deltaproteobacteria bacterium]